MHTCIGTTWEAVCEAYPDVTTLFPLGPPPTNSDILFLAALPAKEGALTFNPNSANEFKLGTAKPRQAQNVKAALAQSVGLVSQYAYSS